LRDRCKRPRECGSAEKSDELAPLGTIEVDIFDKSGPASVRLGPAGT